MPYILIYRMGELTYYVQDYKGVYVLNGLINNAKEFPESQAKRAKSSAEKQVGRQLEVVKIPFQHR